MDRIELIAKRREDLQGGKPDYSVYAGKQLIGRIYQTNLLNDTWFWGVNGVTVDMSIGAIMHGYAASLGDAKMNVRAGFEKWLAWARSMAPSDLKYPRVSAELAKIEDGK